MALYDLPRHRLSPVAEPAPFNWRRGLFRTWLLISAAWIMSWAIYLTMYGLKGGYIGNTDFMAIPILLFAPPVALWLFGMATGWAFQGFRAD